MLTEDRILVTVGEHDLTSRNTKSENKKVSKIHVYPGYKCPKFIDDIALLELESDISWTKSVGPACFPLNGVIGNLADRPATAAGWGWTHEDQSRGKRILVLFVTINCRCSVLM